MRQAVTCLTERRSCCGTSMLAKRSGLCHITTIHPKIALPGSCVSHSPPPRRASHVHVGGYVVHMPNQSFTGPARQLKGQQQSTYVRIEAQGYMPTSAVPCIHEGAAYVSDLRGQSPSNAHRHGSESTRSKEISVQDSNRYEPSSVIAA